MREKEKASLDARNAERAVVELPLNSDDVIGTLNEQPMTTLD